MRIIAGILTMAVVALAQNASTERDSTAGLNATTTSPPQLAGKSVTPSTTAQTQRTATSSFPWIAIVAGTLPALLLIFILSLYHRRRERGQRSERRSSGSNKGHPRPCQYAMHPSDVTARRTSLVGTQMLQDVTSHSFLNPPLLEDPSPSWPTNRRQNPLNDSMQSNDNDTCFIVTAESNFVECTTTSANDSLALMYPSDYTISNMYTTDDSRQAVTNGSHLGDDVGPVQSDLIPLTDANMSPPKAATSPTVKLSDMIHSHDATSDYHEIASTKADQSSTQAVVMSSSDGISTSENRQSNTYTTMDSNKAQPSFASSSEAKTTTGAVVGSVRSAATTNGTNHATVQGTDSTQQSSRSTLAHASTEAIKTLSRGPLSDTTYSSSSDNTDSFMYTTGASTAAQYGYESFEGGLPSAWKPTTSTKPTHATESNAVDTRQVPLDN
ncbi:hypothetical protein AC1031_016726 [Aphanomyces cochlioides]|nr:hypothetical protein AC1031_016726 [Aphanomyces cochlioides]